MINGTPYPNIRIQGSLLILIVLVIVIVLPKKHRAQGAGPGPSVSRAARQPLSDRGVGADVKTAQNYQFENPRNSGDYVAEERRKCFI